MGVRQTVQSKLDKVLLPYGILSHHIRRVEVGKVSNSTVKVNQDEYVVYRIVSSKGGAHGDGCAQIVRYYVDVNYYYAYEKTDARFVDAEKRIKQIIAEFKSDKHFCIANGESDIYDIDNPYRGINVEFLYVEAVKRGG